MIRVIILIKINMLFLFLFDGKKKKAMILIEIFKKIMIHWKKDNKSMKFDKKIIEN